ncbi:hypothetical protein NHX12_001215 [Muraenolepis orangiensis]|uniref:Protein tweety homolog n=1 Tax=Muraenolepis orangiensis TaxID=630683 RepID=A0A9Q0E0G6_9TELE|nr:hypothetical protein NHX12_001215 [Muraenolepis orangiensis]
MAAIALVPSYSPSLWVRVCHALPRLDLSMVMRDNSFVPDSWEYQQVKGTQLPVTHARLTTTHSSSNLWESNQSFGLTRGVGFYGNSEANDGMYQLTSSLLTANYTLASIDLLISDTVSGLQLSVAGPLASMEEQFAGSKSFLMSTRNCRRLSDNVVHLLSSVSMARAGGDGRLGNDSVSGAGAPIAALTTVPPSTAPTLSPGGGMVPSPFSPGWAANTLMVNEDYRWLSYLLLLLLDLIVCLFILLGLAKQARWLLILMTVLAWLALFLSWGSLGLETASVVALSDFCTDPNAFVLNSTHFNSGTSSDVLDYYLTCSRRMSSPFQQLLTQTQRALSSIHTHLSSLDRNALPQFPKAEKSLREVQQILNSTEGNFHQLVALLNCRGLNKDYIDSLKGLCYDGMEGLLYLSLYSFLSALAFTAILCSLPGAWRSFPSDSEEYEDSDSESEDPFTSHQARRQTTVGSQRGALPPFYNYPGASWTPPFSSAPPLP